MGNNKKNHNYRNWQICLLIPAKFNSPVLNSRFWCSTFRSPSTLLFGKPVEGGFKEMKSFKSSLIFWNHVGLFLRLMLKSQLLLSTTHVKKLILTQYFSPQDHNFSALFFPWLKSYFGPDPVNKGKRWFFFSCIFELSEAYTTRIDHKTVQKLFLKAKKNCRRY